MKSLRHFPKHLHPKHKIVNIDFPRIIYAFADIAPAMARVYCKHLLVEGTDLRSLS